MGGRKGMNYKALLSYLVVALFIGYIVIQYIVYGPKQSGIVSGKLEDPGFPYSQWQVFFFIHIATGAIALAAGPFQFLKASRKKISIHRIIGRIYVSSIFLSVPAGIYLAFYATGGMGSTIGFLCLDAAWFITAFVGLKRIRERKINSHQEWMIRSYAVTLVFITFRIFLPLLTFVAGTSFALGFPLAVFLSMILNLGLAEWYLHRKRSSKVSPRLSV
ncbi:DUF2306 domain-containing protein [Fictibacillus sp. WQ 8-8]|uniref:DUF2306 domain-containing protein n=1 Tax=Fictibacillus sp. WQ 8-8 TaxID=2938788 RepID=UPI00210C5C65|nr:DUF2306 domain-containing protein [Fictibacillus sp. WQ 8-8]MCQ6267632.1 DUF2306 domain-containing protein [Fictibacillus sp. WQ 8-8]